MYPSGNLFIPAEHGQLEAILKEPRTGLHKSVALVLHPHPLGGGTMHNKVVFHTMKTLNGFGFPVLRFNFRGTGLSQGEHDEGRGEVEDVRTALHWLREQFHLPIIFAGFSFGTAVGLRAACPDPDVAAMISLGTPVSAVDERAYDFSFLQSCTQPKLFVSGERDQFGPRAKLEQLVASLPEPKRLVIIEGADHFFAGRLAELRKAIEEWVRETVAGSR